MCLAMQRAEDMAGAGSATERQLRQVLNETLMRLGAPPMESPSVRQWLEGWLQSKHSIVADSTLRTYRQTIRDFLAFLGKRADSKLETVTTGTIEAFRDHLRQEGLGTSTIRKTIRGFLSGPFRVAWRMGKLQSNPVSFVAIESKRDRKARKRSRKPFSADQAKALLDAAPSEEWRTLILIGYFTGARLRDVLSLTADNIDIPAGIIRFTQRKTGDEVVVPMHEDLAANLQQGRVGKLFPTLSAQREGGRNGLSVQFQAIVTAAGIHNPIVQKKGAGRGRTIRSYTFHSLRHSFASALANAGVAPELRRELTGHRDAASHQRYTHHEIDRLREAMAKIPSL
jgi:integrase